MALRLTRPTTPFTYQKATQHPRPGKRRRAKTAGAEPLVCRVAATPYPAYNAIYLSEGYSTPQTRQAPPGKDSGRGAACVPGGASLTRPTTPFTYQKATQHPRPGKRRRARTAGAVPLLCRVAATPYPAWSSCDLSLIYSPALLKLPVLAASKSLRRSRKAGAARMDAG